MVEKRYWETDWHVENREKLKQQKRDWYYQNKSRAQETQTKSYRLRTYGLSHEEYLEMLEEQNHVCAICHNPEELLNPSGTPRPLCVDHCHTTGNIRGLLCNRCNILLSRAKDNVSILQNAIQYLKDSW